MPYYVHKHPIVSVTNSAGLTREFFLTRLNPATAENAWNVVRDTVWDVARHGLSEAEAAFCATFASAEATLDASEWPRTLHVKLL